MKYLKTVITIAFISISLSNFAQNKAINEAFMNSYEFSKKDNYEAAITEIKNVYHPDSYEMNLRLGWLYYLANKNDKSAEFYKKAIIIMPAATEPLWAIIYPYTIDENWIEIEKQYLAILKLDPMNANANYGIGMIYYYRLDYVTAKKHFDVALNQYPFGYSNMLMSGWANYFLGNKNDAFVLFNKVLLYSPNDASALEGLGLIK
jgi:tetratricopeptide (TPR) repeat protein